MSRSLNEQLDLHAVQTWFIEDKSDLIEKLQSLQLLIINNGLASVKRDFFSNPTILYIVNK